MLRVISPEESAQNARQAIVEGCRLIAEGQAMVLGAVKALEMFERNFRSGFYQEKPRPEPNFDITVTPKPDKRWQQIDEGDGDAAEG